MGCRGAVSSTASTGWHCYQGPFRAPSQDNDSSKIFCLTTHTDRPATEPKGTGPGGLAEGVDTCMGRPNPGDRGLVLTNCVPTYVMFQAFSSGGLPHSAQGPRVPALST